MTAIKDALIGARFLDKGGAFFNVKHPDFGAEGDGVADDGPAWNLARASVATAGGVVLVPPGAYLLTTAFSFGSNSNVLLWLFPGVVLTGEALPTPTGTNAILDWRSGVFSFSGLFAINDDLVIDGSLDVIDDLVIGGLLDVTNDSVVGGSLDVTDELDLAGDIELSERDIDLTSTPQHNLETGTVTVQRVSATGIISITGLTGGRAGRIIYFQKVAPIADITFTHEDANSVEANRIQTHDGSAFTLTGRGAMWIRYDSVLSRWILGPHSN